MLKVQVLKPKVKLQAWLLLFRGLVGEKRIKKQNQTPTKQAFCFKTFHDIRTCKTYRNVPESCLTSVYFLETPLDLCNIHAKRGCSLPLDM